MRCFSFSAALSLSTSPPLAAMGNYSSTEIEVFKGIVSAAGSETHTLDDQDSNNHDQVWNHLRETLQEPDLLSLKFLHNFTETAGEPSEPKTDAPAKPEVSPSQEVSSACSNAPSVSSLVSILGSSDCSSPCPKPRLTAHGPPTLQKLNVELQDMREDLELLKTQHKREIKLLMSELDEEKKMRLSLQVEVERLKKHMSN